MKKLFIVLSCLISSLVFADVQVRNHTPYPIKFEMHWLGVVPYWGLGKAWVDKAAWPDEIPGGQTKSRGGELWNTKTRYIIKAKINAHWQEVINKETSEGGNRRITIYYSPDPETGEQKWKIETALW